MNRCNIFAAIVLASAQVQRGGSLCFAQGLITCSNEHLIVQHTFLRAYTPAAKRSAKCNDVASELNKVIQESSNPMSCDFGSNHLKVSGGRSKCNNVAVKLNKAIFVDLNAISCDGIYDLRVQQSAPTPCADVAAKLTALVADGIEAKSKLKFYQSALSLTGVAFIWSVIYARRYLGRGHFDLCWFVETVKKEDGDKLTKSWKDTLLFALFVALRIFDLCSDWGMYGVTLASAHKGTALRDASLVFSVIGSLLTFVDLSTMIKRAEHWFGIEDASSESLKSVGYGMMAIVLFEDIPQMIITIVYFAGIDAAGTGRNVDPIAIISFVLSIMSLLSNGFIGVRSLR